LYVILSEQMLYGTEMTRTFQLDAAQFPGGCRLCWSSYYYISWVMKCNGPSCNGGLLVVGSNGDTQSGCANVVPLATDISWTNMILTVSQPYSYSYAVYFELLATPVKYLSVGESTAIRVSLNNPALMALYGPTGGIVPLEIVSTLQSTDVRRVTTVISALCASQSSRLLT
jgi:hypothetical protein